MSYRKLEIWQIARQLIIDIQKMTLNELPQKDHQTNCVHFQVNLDDLVIFSMRHPATRITLYKKR